MPNIIITIAICTWNQCNSLRHTLTSLQKMVVPDDIEWEVLVVNNNCTDDTDTVIASFADTLPIRSLLETQQGLSNARNCAVDAARGSYILWTDDDVIVDPHWLAAYVDAFRIWPDAALFGGPIVPKFEGTQQPWLLIALQDDRFADVYATRDLGAESINLDLAGNKIPYGANFSVRMKEQRQFSYNPKLGRSKYDNILGEETDVVSKLLNFGAEGRWVPNAPVRHVIPKHRQTEASLRYYFVGEGRTYVRNNPAHHSTSFLGVPRWLWRAAVTSHFRFYLKRLYAPPKIWSQELRQASIYWGQLLECIALTRRT